MTAACTICTYIYIHTRENASSTLARANAHSREKVFARDGTSAVMLPASEEIASVSFGLGMKQKAHQHTMQTSIVRRRSLGRSIISAISLARRQRLYMYVRVIFLMMVPASLAGRAKQILRVLFLRSKFRRV